MIALDAVHARLGAEAGRPASTLKNVSLTWERGVLAVLGTPADGTCALLELLSGRIHARAGVATVLGEAPARARASIAYVPLSPVLPDPLTVEEVCRLAGQIRGERVVAATVLTPLGVEKLASRRVRSLTVGEARAVSLAIALSSNARVLLLEEPLSGLDPSAPSRVIEVLRARGAAGAAVVLTTASVRDATLLGDQLGVLTQGVFTHLPPALAHVGVSGARVRIVVLAQAASEVAPFVAALTEEAAIASIETATFAGTRVLHAAVAIVVTGADLLDVSRAVARAASRTRTAALAIESEVVPLDAIRARIAAPRPGVLLSRPPPVHREGGLPEGLMPGTIPPAALPGTIPPAGPLPGPPPGESP